MILQEKSLDYVKILSVDYDALIKALKKISHEIKKRYSHILKVLLFGSFSINFTP